MKVFLFICFCMIFMQCCVSPKKPAVVEFPATSNIADIPAHPTEEIYAPKEKPIK